MHHTGPVISLETERLLLRRWQPEDRVPFAALNGDPEVMQHFPRPLSRPDSDAMIERIEATFDAHGFGLFAVEECGSGAFIGFVGLWPTGFDAHFTPAVEVGWRLARHAWGSGYATEAARAAVTDGFARLGLAEIVSFTAVVNERSQRVMAKIGMTHDPTDDFDHPSLPVGHRLERHVLYRLRRQEL